MILGSPKTCGRRCAFGARSASTGDAGEVLQQDARETNGICRWRAPFATAGSCFTFSSVTSGRPRWPSTDSEHDGLEIGRRFHVGGKGLRPAREGRVELPPICTVELVRFWKGVEGSVGMRVCPVGGLLQAGVAATCCTLYRGPLSSRIGQPPKTERAPENRSANPPAVGGG